MIDNVRPMPLKYGVGFVTEKPLDDVWARGYRYEKVGMHHNYHVTPDNWDWPVRYNHEDTSEYVVDAFSPNLNKSLHVGHLRNLAIAKSLQSLLRRWNPRFVALLGASLGVHKNSTVSLRQWTELVGYHPEIYYDVLQPIDIIQMREPTVEEVEGGVIDVNEGPDLALPKLWDGPKGPVVVVRADGRPLYAYYDLAFAKEVGPTHYVTGHEQKEHFASLGFEKKHLPMGLVLGEDGTKLKSRTGDAMKATEALGWMVECIGNATRDRVIEPDAMKRLAWNIFAWNFLHASRETNLKFEVEKWVRTEAPGMYITYTYARLRKALGLEPQIFYEGRSGKPNDEDAKLLGISSQYYYYQHKAIAKMDPAPIANFAQDLSRQLNLAYEREPISGGRMPFFGAVSHATDVLRACMTDLGMFLIKEV